MSTHATDAGVLCAGRLYCDLIFTGAPRLPTLGSEVFAEGLSVHPGGGAFITAGYLASLGRPASLGAMLPAPPFAGLIRADLEAAGLDLSLCGSLDSGGDPQVTVAIAHGHDRAFLTRRSGPPCAEITRADLARLGARHLHIGELGTLIERPDLLLNARSAGMTVSLDCGWDEAVNPVQAAALIAGVDVFLPNASEVNWLRKAGLAEPLAPLVVTKRGSAGADAQAGQARVSMPGCEVTVVDATGAGDAFNAGFLHAWLDGATLEACLTEGNRLGAAAVQNSGGFARTDAAPMASRVAGASHAP